MREIRCFAVLSTGIGLMVTMYVSKMDEMAFIGAALVLVGWVVDENTWHTLAVLKHVVRHEGQRRSSALAMLFWYVWYALKRRRG